jgi:hypothetical protein
MSLRSIDFGAGWRRRMRAAHLSRWPANMSRTSGRSDLVDIAGELRGETERAYRIYDGTRTEWVPKQFVEFDPSDNTFAMPEWLAKDRGFV